MVLLCGMLAVALVAVLAYLRLVLRQIRAAAAQIEQHLSAGRRCAVTLELVSPDLERLVARINDLARTSEVASTRALREERRFRSFIADISHDLRTPLTTVRGHLQILARADLPAVHRDQLERARRNTAELEALVDRLYEYTYLLEVDPSLEEHPVDVGILVGECLLGMAPELEAAGLDVHYEPPSALMLCTDSSMLTRIVQNLGRNAAQHGQQTLQVTVDRAATDQASAVALEFTNPVRDGTMLEPQRMFERFYTADGSRSGRTSGLGLSIVAALTEQLGGEVSARVAPDDLFDDDGTDDQARAAGTGPCLTLRVLVPDQAMLSAPRPVGDAGF